MDFSPITLTPDQESLQREAHDLLEEILTQDVRQAEREHGHSFDAGVHQALGARGWLEPGWPVEEGGAGLDKLGQRILELELVRHEAPWITAGTTRLVTTAVKRFAQPELAAELLPKVARGDARFCLGYTEPDGGSDIAAAKTRAVKDGDEWVINGSKIFTTGAQNCQYTFLITRTDPELPKHRGLTMFLVPLDTPGVEIQGIRAFSGERTNVVYYADVRISDRYRLGNVNDGWSVLKGPLDEEHNVGTDADAFADTSIGVTFLRSLELALDATVRWATETVRPDGTHPADDPLVQRAIGLVTTELEQAAGTSGAMGRVAGSEALVRGAALLHDIVGPESLLQWGDRGPLHGRIDEAHRYAQGTATYGGTVEVFRTIIAQHVLQLPRPVYPGAKVLTTGGARR